MQRTESAPSTGSLTNILVLQLVRKADPLRLVLD